jgi:hypothetical protein
VSFTNLILQKGYARCKPDPGTMEEVSPPGGGLPGKTVASCVFQCDHHQWELLPDGRWKWEIIDP